LLLSPEDAMTLPNTEPSADAFRPTESTSTPRPQKFGGLAWATLILGIVGVIGSPVIFLNNVTAVIAGVGFILGVIALFGSKKVLAAIGTVLCVGAITFTIIAQNSVTDDFRDRLGLPAQDTNASGQTYQVGQTHHGSIVDITIADPQSFTTGNSAFPKQNSKAINYTISVTNHSDKPWSPVLFQIQATAGNISAEEVFDSAAGLNGVPTQDVLPGKNLTFRIGFVESPGDFTIQVGDFDEKIYFLHKR
jgi:hypothetical protein